MPDRPYSKVPKEKMILRDYLATDRTILANERTFLAYVRTGLTLFVAGVTFIHFFHPVVIIVLGWIFMPLGVIVLIMGVMRYRRMQKLLREMELTGPSTSNAQ